MRTVRLKDAGYDGVGPEALGGAVLGLHLLGLRCRVGVTGIQHGLQDPSAGVNEPEQRGEGGGEAAESGETCGEGKGKGANDEG